jgi:hypothetical protein
VSVRQWSPWWMVASKLCEEGKKAVVSAHIWQVLWDMHQIHL